MLPADTRKLAARAYGLYVVAHMGDGGATSQHQASVVDEARKQAVHALQNLGLDPEAVITVQACIEWARRT